MAATAFDVIREIAGARASRRILDIGCGQGELLARLSQAGFDVAGVEPGSQAVAVARRRNPGVTIHQSGAERLPAGLGSFGLVAMVNALHHVPVAAMAQAISEVRKILEPGGVLVAIEPAAHGSFFAAMLPIEDETVIRGAAQIALQEAVNNGRWRLEQDFDYVRDEVFGDVDSFIARVVAVDPSRAQAALDKREAVEAAFLEQARRDADGMYQLSSPIIVKVLAPI